ncbi:MAG: hydroxymethylbilane synthase [bacterium]
MTATNQPASLRIGTRRSALAKAQTRWVVGELTRIHPQIRIEIVEVVTTGDKILDSPLSRIPGKGVFVKEIEEKLLAREIDLAVHSMKDLPTEFPDGLKIAATPARVDPRDVFISKLGKDLTDMPEGARIGTSSLRRKAQLLRLRPDLQVVDIRGNIDTRLKKVETEAYDGTILAAAGLIRMGWQDRIQEFLSCEVMIPAVGQGALGIEARAEDVQTLHLVAPLDDEVTAKCVAAERVFLQGMGGGCQTPMAAFCRQRDGKIVFQAFHALEDGSHFQTERREGTLADATQIAEAIVHKFRQQCD